MKNLIALILFIVVTTTTMAQNKGNYKLTIGDEVIFLNLDESTTYRPKRGPAVQILLSQPLILHYEDEMVSFSYDKNLNVSNTAIDMGVEQCMVMRSTGNGFIIQKYNNFNPSPLTSMLLSEVTKESVNYGYTRKDKPFRYTLKNGMQLEGTQAILRYKGEEEVYTVAAVGGKDQGILIMTMLINPDFNDNAIIDLMLETLDIRLP
jgi:hypothetical protein